MSDKNTGGSAFPQEARYIAPNGETGSHGPCGGMHLRDYFAAKAMAARLSDYQSLESLTEYAIRTGQHLSDVVADQAYDMADAMIKARKS